MNIRTKKRIRAIVTSLIVYGFFSILPSLMLCIYAYQLKNWFFFALGLLLTIIYSIILILDIKYRKYNPFNVTSSKL